MKIDYILRLFVSRISVLLKKLECNVNIQNSSYQEQIKPTNELIFRIVLTNRARKIFENVQYAEEILHPSSCTSSTNSHKVEILLKIILKVMYY